MPIDMINMVLNETLNYLNVMFRMYSETPMYEFQIKSK
ncbi:putative transposase for [Staphylococcus epidermidis]|nr:putative transposase for [Staphylococcus epidermidis]